MQSWWCRRRRQRRRWWRRPRWRLSHSLRVAFRVRASVTFICPQLPPSRQVGRPSGPRLRRGNSKSLTKPSLLVGVAFKAKQFTNAQGLPKHSLLVCFCLVSTILASIAPAMICIFPKPRPSFLNSFATITVRMHRLAQCLFCTEKLLPTGKPADLQSHSESQVVFFY